MSPLGVAVTPDGTRAYVTNAVQQHRLGDRHGQQHGGRHGRGRDCPSWGGHHPGRDTRLCDEYRRSNTVSVIDTASNTVVATVAVGSMPRGVAITPDGTRVYVTNTAPTPSR